jgi:hypothetical protein
MTEETKIKQQIKGYLKIRNIDFCYFLQGLGAMKGIPDIAIFYKGKTIWVEIKKPKGILSNNQIDFKDMCERNNINYLVARRLEDVSDIL